MRVRLLLLAVALAAAAAGAFAEVLPALSLSVTGDTGPAGIPAAAVADRLASAIGAWYEGILELAPRGGPQSSAAPSARVVLSSTRDGISARTELERDGVKSARATVVPLDAPAGLIPAIAGDLAYLWCASSAFSTIKLSSPPALEAALSTNELALLTGWNADEMEPIGITGTEGSITLAFPHGWLTLGPLFSLTAETARDLLAQSFGREALQISAIVRMRRNGLALLSERGASIAWVDPRLGLRQVSPAPGLAAGHAERLGGSEVCVLTGGGLAAWRSDGAPARRIGGLSWASAFTTDWEGNLWVFDARESRIRILAPDGKEVHSIRPLARASSLQFPQSIAVLADGSFLLGGAGEVWRFKSSGVPVWRLNRIEGAVSEALPSSFQIAADRRTGSFILLDGPSRRLLAFAGDAPLPRAAAVGGDGAMESAGAGATRGDGLLLALQEGARAERRGQGSEALSAARLEVQRSRTTLLATLARSLREDILSDQAERALLRASESARECLAEDPADERTARLLEELVAQRRELRDELTQEPGVEVSQARAVAGLRPSGRTLAVSFALRNARSFPLSRVRIALAAPGLSRMPSLAEIGTLSAGQVRQVEMTIPLVDAADDLDASVPAAARVSWERGTEGGAASVRFTLQIVPGSRTEASAALRDALLAEADPDEPLVRTTAAEMSFGADEPLTAAAAVLDTLGRLRGAAAAAATVLPRAATPAPQAHFPPAPQAHFLAAVPATQPSSWPAAHQSVRATLRGLSADPLDWSLLTADIIGALGFPVGIAAWQDAAVVLVDTGVGLARALGGLPALARDEALLQKLSRNGHLCVPLSGGLLPSGAAGAFPSGAAGAFPSGAAGAFPSGAAGAFPSGAAGAFPSGAAGAFPSGAASAFLSPSAMTPSVFALIAGLQACRERGIESAALGWRDETGPVSPRPQASVPFSSRFAFVTEHIDRDTLASMIRLAMEKQR